MGYNCSWYKLGLGCWSHLVGLGLRTLFVGCTVVVVVVVVVVALIIVVVVLVFFVVVVVAVVLVFFVVVFLVVASIVVLVSTVSSSSSRSTGCSSLTVAVGMLTHFGLHAYDRLVIPYSQQWSGCLAHRIVLVSSGSRSRQ